MTYCDSVCPCERIECISKEMIDWFIKYYKWYLESGQKCDDVKSIIERATGKKIQEVTK